MAPSTNALLFLIFLSPVFSFAKVPRDKTFRYVNEGDTGEYPFEYHAEYRFVPVPRPGIFALVMYTTNSSQFPGAQYYLGIRMGYANSDSTLRLVWEANRGNPVGENATVTFGADGNLVLADADGRVAWATGTANKGVVGVEILESGNLVLYDKKKKPVWQSFEHPTDTLLPGQTLYTGGKGPTTLVSRASPTDNRNGIYSLVADPNGVHLYITPTASPSSNPLRYAYLIGVLPGDEAITKATFVTSPDVYSPPSHSLSLSTNVVGRMLPLGTTTFNATYSFLRLETDGNLAAYSFYDPEFRREWKRTFSYFDDNGNYLPGCSLPSKCGTLGLCKNSMCVGCPTSKGVVGWSKGCAPPKKGACGKGGAWYYKVVGVESFVPALNEGEKGAVKVEECRRRCSSDCGCVGFFYWEKESRCWLAPVLGTLSKVDNSTHVAYLKYSK